MRKISNLAVLMVLACITVAPAASSEPVSAKYTWLEPSTGTTPVQYLVEMRFRHQDDADFGLWGQMGETREQFFILFFEPGYCYQIRVRAQDAAGLLGPYSTPSVESCQPVIEDTGGGLDELPPLPPGKPGEKG